MVNEGNINDEFYDLEPDDYRGIIKFYKNHKLVFDNKSIFNDKREFKNHIVILAKYIISLEKTGKYRMVISSADNFLNFIESRIAGFEIEKSDCVEYWSILTSKGRALYNIKDYKESIRLFKQLLLWDPENDNFQEWLRASKFENRNSFNKYLYISAGLIFFVSFLFQSQVGVTIRIIGIVFFVIALANEYYGDKIINWFMK